MAKKVVLHCVKYRVLHCGSKNKDMLQCWYLQHIKSAIAKLDPLSTHAYLLHNWSWLSVLFTIHL